LQKYVEASIGTGRKEKDSIVYFLAFKAFVPTEAGKNKIDNIIKEDIRHIAILNRSIKEFI
jgi:hypothetical protein